MNAASLPLPLKKGMYDNDAVAELQRILNTLGYSVNVDGDFGAITDLAVKQFQAGASLFGDGIVGKMTAAALDAALGVPVVVGSNIYVDLMYGLGDSSTSAGMDVLSAALRALSPRMIVSKTDSWSERDAVIKRIWKRPTNTRNLLMGNSLGANSIPLVTNECFNHWFDLIVGYDPSWAWTNKPLTRNIKKAVQYKGTNLLSLLGKMSYVEAFPGQLTIIKTSVLHSWIDDDLGLHKQTISYVKDVLKT